MATSRKQLYDAYKKSGGTKTFKAFGDAIMEKARKKDTTPSTKQKVDKAKKMVSGKLEQNLRKPIKRKYST